MTQVDTGLAGTAMFVIRTVGLFALTAVAEVVGCYLPYLVLRRAATAWLLAPAVFSLFAFAWLLTLHPTLATGRTYAAYGGVYVVVALGWLWRIDGVTPDRWDLVGAGLAVLGMAVIAFAPRL